MLKFFLTQTKKNFLKKLEFVLNSRKLKQQNKSNLVKQILINVKKKGDRAVLNYEKNFPK